MGLPAVGLEVLGEETLETAGDGSMGGPNRGGSGPRAPLQPPLANRATPSRRRSTSSGVV